MSKQQVESIAQQSLDTREETEQFYDLKRGITLPTQFSEEEKYEQYFAAKIFSRDKDIILDYLYELSAPLILTNPPKNLPSKLAITLMAKYRNFRWQGKSFQVFVDESKKKDARILPKDRPDLYKQTESVLDSLINSINRLLKTTTSLMERDYQTFGISLYGDFAKVHDRRGGPEIEEGYYDEDFVDNVIAFFDSYSIPFDLGDRQVMLEVVGFLAHGLQQGTRVEDLLEDIKFVHVYFGKRGFPWQLSSMTQLSTNYKDKSDYSKIVKRGIIVDVACRYCKSFVVVETLRQTRSNDEGQSVKRECAQCGKRR